MLFSGRMSHQDSKGTNLRFLKSRFGFHFSAPPQHAHVSSEPPLCLLVPTSPVIHCDLAMTFLSSALRACKNRKPSTCLTVMRARDLKTRARTDTRTSCPVSLASPLLKIPQMDRGNEEVSEPSLPQPTLSSRAGYEVYGTKDFRADEGRHSLFLSLKKGGRVASDSLASVVHHRGRGMGGQSEIGLSPERES